MKRRNFLTNSVAVSGLFTISAFGCSNDKDEEIILAGNRIIREAHRGANLVFPENTLPAFEEALRIGVDRLELDLRMSSDGELVVFHDDTLEMTSNGKGKVADFSISELKQLDAGSWKSSKFQGLKIPTLKEVFELVNNKCFVNIDLKVADAGQLLVKLAEEMDMADSIVITGKIPECVESIREINNSITMFYEFSDDLPVRQPKLAVRKIREKQLPGCLVNYKNVDSAFVRQCKLHGLSVSTWGVQTKEEMKNLITLGVDSVMADDILLLNQIINQK